MKFLRWNTLRWFGLAACVLVMFGAWQLRQRSDVLAQQRQRFLASPLPGTSERAQWIVAGKAEAKAVQSAISGQLEAFRRNDYTRAAKWQSQGLKDNFPTVQVFRDVIRKNYPQFANSKSVRYGKAIMSRDKKFVSIEALIVGKDGKIIGAVYDMIRENGQFRVAGVLPLKPDAPQPNAPNTEQAPSIAA